MTQLNLTQAQVQYLLNMLAQRPYGEVAALIQTIVEQSAKPEGPSPDGGE